MFRNCIGPEALNPVPVAAALILVAKADGGPFEVGYLAPWRCNKCVCTRLQPSGTSGEVLGTPKDLIDCQGDKFPKCCKTSNFFPCLSEVSGLMSGKTESTCAKAGAVAMESASSPAAYRWLEREWRSNNAGKHTWSWTGKTNFSPVWKE